MNPADVHRKEQRKKEIKKNKVERGRVRKVALAVKDTGKIEAELDMIKEKERYGRLDKNHLEKKKVLEEKLQKIIEMKKEMGVKYEPKSAQEAAAATVSEKRDPKRSVYYHPLLNPQGAPPPGKPYREIEGDGYGDSNDKHGSDSSDDDSDSDSDSDADASEGVDDVDESEEKRFLAQDSQAVTETIPSAVGPPILKTPGVPQLPTGPRSEKKWNLFGILPEQHAIVFERGPPPIPHQPAYAPPMPYHRPPPFPPYHVPPPSQGFPPFAYPPPIPGGQFSRPPPFPPHMHPPRPPMYNAPFPPPPQPMGHLLDPSRPPPTQPAAGTAPLPSSSMSNAPPAKPAVTVEPAPSTIISASPQIRDFEREITSLVPTNIRRKRPAPSRSSKSVIGGSMRPLINAAPDLGDDDSESTEVVEEASSGAFEHSAPPNATIGSKVDGAEKKVKLVPVIQPGPPAAKPTTAADEYSRFMKEMGDLI